ncbi:MAG: formate dehydrogenase accessory sulfurtransferase FdhD [Planctomycetota bacterium]
MSEAGWQDRRLGGGDEDALVREEPLRIEVAGQSLVTMRTPGQDEDLVLGFLLAEGLIAEAAEVEALERLPGSPRSETEEARPDRLFVRLRGEASPARQGMLRRVQEIRPSCGLCGVEELVDLVPEGRELRRGWPEVARARIPALFEAFTARQELFKRTGGSHASALVTPAGEVAGFGEDVGRHNALDKAIGQAVRGGADPSGLLCLLSGRAGYELVAKALRVGCPMILSLSAATALAFDLCREAGATLCGFCRGDGMRVYWDAGRLVG